MSYIIGRGRYARETYPLPPATSFSQHLGTDKTNDNVVDMPAGGVNGYADFIPHDTTGDPTPVSFDLVGYVPRNPIRCGYTIQLTATDQGALAQPKFYLAVNYNNGDGQKTLDMFDQVSFMAGEGSKTHSVDYTIVPPANAVNPTFRLWVVQEAVSGPFRILGSQMNVWAEEFSAAAATIVTAQSIIDPPQPL
jgi:hypothetical protein